MKVSILIPVHGECPFLEKTLKSLEGASLASCEIIVVLDRAKEGPINLLAEFKKCHNDVTIVESHGIGISNALNTGLLLSNTEFIARLDCDDLVFPERFQDQLRTLVENPKVTVLGTQISLINEFDKVIGSKKYPSHPRNVLKVLKFQNCIAHPSVMFRRKEVMEAGGYDSSFDGAEDFDLWTRLSASHLIMNSKETLIKYRISENQVTRKNKLYPGELEFKVLLRNSKFGKEISIEENSSSNLRDSNNQFLMKIREKSFVSYLRLIGLRNLLGLIHSINKNPREKIFRLILSLLLAPVITVEFLTYQAWRKLQW